MQRPRYAEPNGLKRKPSGAGFVFSVVTLAILSSVASQVDPSAAASMYASLTDLSLPQTKITLAQSHRAGGMVSGVTKAPVNLCRVAGTSQP
jgi:hypothetical protein